MRQEDKETHLIAHKIGLFQAGILVINVLLLLLSLIGISVDGGVTAWILLVVALVFITVQVRDIIRFRAGVMFVKDEEL